MGLFLRSGLRRSNVSPLARWLVVVANLGLAHLSGCFGGCGPDTPGIEVNCVEATAPADGAARVLFGSVREDAFRELDDGDRFTVEFGDQGGQHFFYAMRLFQPQAGRIVKITLSVTEAVGGGGSGGAAGGGGGTAVAPPNDFVFLDDYIEAEDCEGWMQLQNLPFQTPTESGEGQLLFELGTCNAGSCQVGPDGTYQLTTVEAAFSVRVAWSAPS